MTSIAGHTPVIIGAAQFTERSDDPGYETLSPVAITARAAQLALADAGLATAATQIDTVMTTRIFEDSAPVLEFPFGRSNNFPRSVCRRLGIEPATAIWATAGGDTPQKLVTEACDRIAAGQSHAVLIAGGEALSTSKYLQKQGAQVDWSESIDEPVEDRGAAVDYLTHDEIVNGLITPPLFYGFMENARRIAAGKSPEAWAADMGALFAPLAAVAANNPLAAQRDRAFTPGELITPETGNRLIASPYAQRLVARDQVNQSAALVVVSTAFADELGVAEAARVYLHGQAVAGEPPVSLRPDIGAAPSAGLALNKALDRAGCSVDQISLFDFYSCFPIAVSNAIEALGLAPNDPRGLTITGGLPYFGGPGNSYSMHALAELVVRLRALPGDRGLVAANGGFLTKYAVGVYSTTPTAHIPYDSADLAAEMDRNGTVAVDSTPNGTGRLEAYTVAYDRESTPKVATIAGRLDESGQRFLAKVDREDMDTLQAVVTGDPGGRSVTVTPGAQGNRFRFTP
ncbi:MAG: acetyl-CoA acetyltransferase [Cellvibrionales bacterium]|jgi:acetyl-CoA C-acetyltransferase